ncbi:MAG: hypothetical protein JJT99_14860, partial [Rhodobacteraceae bacterium]|nr:hypothetical protein [Paracoccaceae bacterium]
MTQAINTDRKRPCLRGGRLVKTSRGIVSFAAVTGAALLLAPGSASADSPIMDCLPGTTGPAPGGM